MHNRLFVETNLPIAPEVLPNGAMRLRRMGLDLDYMEAMQEEAELKLLRSLQGRSLRGARRLNDF